MFHLRYWLFQNKSLSHLWDWMNVPRRSVSIGLASCALHAKTEENVNEVNSVSVVQSVHCEGVGTVEEADGKKEKKKERKKSLTREFAAAKKTSIDVKSGLLL